MKITKVWAVYFSPTGNAKKVVTTMAKRAAECLGVPMGTVDFTLPENREGRPCILQHSGLCGPYPEQDAPVCADCV